MKSEHTYRIRPLKWDKLVLTNIILHRAKTAIGIYSVEETIIEEMVEYWAVYVKKGIDIDHLCDSIEHGKKICQKQYEKKLKKCLIEE